MYSVEEICEEQERQYNQLMQEDDQYCHPESFKWGFEHGFEYALSKFDWIPVEEELPKEKQKVLVYMPANELCDHEYMCEALYNYAWHKWEYADEPIELEGITHWMPLPQPPRKEE